MGKNIINRILQNTQKPEGFWGRMILRSMNKGHADVSQWGLSNLQWMPEWNVLDIGCGGGTNLARLLKLCQQGKIYGVDLSPESVAFAAKKNRQELGKRCFVSEGRADKLPFSDEMFDVVTAFETVYFWGDLTAAFAEVNRVLKPNGYFLICNEVSNPANDMWTKRIDGMIIPSAESLEAALFATGFCQTQIHRTGTEMLCVVSQKNKPNK